MYIPPHFDERDTAVLHDLIRSHPLGTWVVATGQGLVVNHVPFVLDPTEGALGTLRAHVARANPVWKEVPGQLEALVVFQGPEAYISPSWYASKHEHGKVVPTWNYAVVHAHGTPRVVDDEGWLRENVARLTQAHEAGREVPWQVSDAPSAFIESMLKAIVGIEIPITTLLGKWKVSQNRPAADRLGVATGLDATADANARQMARLVETRGQRPQG